MSSFPRMLMVTANQTKRKQYGEIARHFGIDLEFTNGSGTKEIQGTCSEIVQAKLQETYLDNRVLACLVSGTRLVLVDDTSFHIDALEGWPGPYVKHVVATPTGAQLLVNMARGVQPEGALMASATCHLACQLSADQVLVGVGQSRGFIDNPSHPPDGSFSPIFYNLELANGQQSESEMKLDQLVTCEHYRFKAFENLLEQIVASRCTGQD